MKPQVRTFTKEDPCTKLDIWNCFRRREGFAAIQVDAAWSQIGKNAPRVMERNGYLIRANGDNGDYYQLTVEGQEWLEKGFRSFLRNHPHRGKEAKFLPRPPGARRRRIRRG